MIFGFLRAFGLVLLKLPMILLGLPVVWFALPKSSGSGELKPFSQFPQYGSWRLVRLPSWALWWDNAFDGMLGDKRGWWANECGGLHNEYFNMWKWAAIRNPANFFSRNVCGVDVSQLLISEVTKGTSWFVLRGVDKSGKVYPRFYLEYPIFKTYGVMIDIGWKIKLDHNNVQPESPEKDRIKGIVFVGSPWKELS